MCTSIYLCFSRSFRFLVMHYPVVQPKHVIKTFICLLRHVFTRLQVFRAVTCLAKLEKLVAIKEYKLVSIEKYNFLGYINSIYVDV